MALDHNEVADIERACRNLGLSKPRVRDFFDLDRDIHRHFFNERDLNQMLARAALDAIQQRTFVYIDKTRKADTENLI